LCINGHLLQRNHGSEGHFCISITVTLQTCFSAPWIHAHKGDYCAWWPPLLNVTKAQTIELDFPSPPTITIGLSPNASFNASLLSYGSL
jgi:hypothetical protein